MEKHHINPPAVFEHPAFTRIITVTGPTKLIWISGMTPQKEDLTAVFPGDYLAQYIFVMEKIAAQLESVGATWDDVTFRRTYTLDVDKMKAVLHDPSTRRFFTMKPCSTLIGVTRLSDPEFLLEIEVMATIEA
jgi:enamine deaminase RidA (YjgF/YER057c/UK114 family)